MKGIKLCAGCANYNLKTHKCRIGAHDESDPQLPFFCDCPLPDVAPVVHGEWIDRDEKTWCNVCHASNKQYKPPYCPHCGAKMDGGKANE